MTLVHANTHTNPKVRWRHSWMLRGERGDAGPLEAVILIPVLLGMFALILAFGRSTGTEGDLEHAARAGARAAVAAQTLEGARANARDVVNATLADADTKCLDQDVDVTGNIGPGGRLTVTVECVIDLQGLTDSLDVPRRTIRRATASEVVDRVRGG